MQLFFRCLVFSGTLASKNFSDRELSEVFRESRRKAEAFREQLRGHREEEELLSRPLLTSSHQYFNVLSQLLLPLSLPTTPIQSLYTHMSFP